MRKALILVAAVAVGMAAPAVAKHHKHHGKMGGHPATVKMDGKDVPVCKDDKSDGCVNPREAGLKWGNHAGTNYHGGHDKK